MCLVPLPADTASVDNPSTRTITLPGPSFLDSTTMKISIFRIPGCAHLTFQAIDVGVVGAASRGHRKRRQSFDADNYVARSILPGLNNNEDFNLQNSGVRALDFPGHRCVRTNGERAEDGGRPVHRTPLSHAGDALSSGRMGAQHSAQT